MDVTTSLQCVCQCISLFADSGKVVQLEPLAYKCCVEADDEAATLEVDV